MPKDLENRLVGKTIGHRHYIKTMAQNIVTFCTGPAGSGKSYSAVGLACQEFVANKFQRIIVSRPAVEASPRGLGYLSGNLMEKLTPFITPAIEHLKYFLGPAQYHAMLNDKEIKFEPLEFCQGKTFNNSFMILDESQNCSVEQIIMFITRIGIDSKVVINGDFRQSSIGNKSGLLKIIDKIRYCELKDFGIVELGKDDIVRNPIIRPFLEAVEDL